MRTVRFAAITLAVALPAAAQWCKPQELQGPYGFQFSGSTTIAGVSQPVATIGRLEFDGQGAITGTASVNFPGYFLGNPVTGIYEANADCSISWKLQDDSGAFQHFGGILTPDLQRAAFRQTDAGGAHNGTLAKMPGQCSDASLQGSYKFSISGGAIPMNPGEIARKISFGGALTADDAGNLSLVRGGSGTSAGTTTVDSPCIVEMNLMLSPDATLKFRGVLVTGGKEVLAIETDPGTTVNAHFRAL
jgi:hypothetical protein